MVWGSAPSPPLLLPRVSSFTFRIVGCLAFCNHGFCFCLKAMDCLFLCYPVLYAWSTCCGHTLMVVFESSILLGLIATEKLAQNSFNNPSPVGFSQWISAESMDGILVWYCTTIAVQSQMNRAYIYTFSSSPSAKCRVLITTAPIYPVTGDTAIR